MKTWGFLWVGLLLLASTSTSGVQAFVLHNMAIDLRARHNIVIGDLRPMQAWGLTEKTFPIQLLDIGAGLKFYFWK